MLLNMKKVKKPIVVIAATVILAIGAIGTTAGAFTAKNTPTVDSDEISEAEEGSTVLIAVKRSDENRFTPEEWKDILSKIEKGELSWADL